MKKVLLFAVTLCGMISFAVDPVAVWNGDFKTKTIGNYTFDENGNTIAANGSSITISNSVGVKIDRSEAIADRGGMAVIYKCSGLVSGYTVKTLATSYAGNGNLVDDRTGVFVAADGQTKGIWDNTRTYTGTTSTTLTTPPGDVLIAFSYQPGRIDNKGGTRLCIKDGDSDYVEAYYNGGLMSSVDSVRGVTIGGTRANASTFPAASGMVIKAVAMFDQSLSMEEIAAYEFPEAENGVKPDGGPYKEIVDGIEWTFLVENGGASLYGRWSEPCIDASTTGSVTLPSALGGCPVIAISNYAFEGCSKLLSVSIPDSVVKIGQAAFEDCSSLTTINIPSSVEILPSCMFQNCSELVSVELSAGLKRIEWSAFEGCGKLADISIPETVEAIEGYAFRYCTALQNKAVDGLLIIDDCLLYCSPTLQGELVIPEGVRIIAGSAFGDGWSGCSDLTSVVIPDTVVSIGQSAFDHCTSVTNLTIPASVREIGRGAFGYCKLEYTEVDGMRIKDGWLVYGRTSQESATVPTGLVGIVDQALSANYGLKSIVINAPSTYFGKGVLTSCTDLTTAVFAEGVTVIPAQTFQICYALRYVTLPSTLKEIGNSAFSSCQALEEIDIPGGVTVIGDYAFSGCKSLKTVVFHNNAPKFGDRVFTSPDNIVFVVPCDAEGWDEVGEKLGVTIRYSDEPIISVPVGEYGSEKIGDYTWEFYITEDGAVIESADWETSKPAVTPAPIGSLVVPSKLNGRTVVGIGNRAFCPSSTGEMNITSIDVPETVTSYGDYVFGTGCNFTAFEFHEGVTKIGSYVLDNCPKMKRLKIPGTLESAGSDPFRCSWSGGVSLEKLELGEGLKEIGDSWFRNLLGSVTELTIPSTVTNIGAYAFQGLGGYVGDSWDYSHAVTLVLPKGLKRIDSFAFNRAGGLRSDYDLTSVDIIGDGAFYKCTHLTGVNLPERMTYLGSEAFRECQSLKSIRIPEGINHNIHHLLYDCGSLTEVTLPSDLTRIGDSWFSECKKMSLTSIPEGVTTIGNHAFSSCQSIRTMHLPDGVTGIGNYAFQGCSGLTEITLPDALTSIGYSAFSGCSGIMEITLSEKITEIPQSCFYDCSALTNITIKGAVETVGQYAFYACKALKSIELPDSVSSIGAAAFENCQSLQSFHYPTSCTIVPGKAFSECTSLRSVELHDDITKIDGSAFYNCSALESIKLPAKLPRIESDTFGVCMSLREVVIPDSVTYISYMAFRHCQSLERLALSKNLTVIDSAAFFNCEKLREIVIPASVTKIYDRAFAGGLYALESIRFVSYPPTVASWSSIFGEGTSDHEFTLYYPVELETAWSSAIAEISALGIKCVAVKPYDGYHAWLSTERSHYAEGETADLSIHLSDAFEGDVYAYLVSGNEEITPELEPICMSAGMTEYVITNALTFIDGPAALSYEVLALTNRLSECFSTNSIYATETLSLTVTNLPPRVELSVSEESRIPTELGRQEQIEWAAHDIALDEAAGFSYAWWVDSRWDLRGSGTATNGVLTLSFDRLGESAVTLRVTDKDGGQTESVIRYWIDPAEYAQVTFDLGKYGERSGGGELNQTIKLGGDAVAPEVETDPDGDYVFDGWDAECTNVNSDITIHAVYRYAPVPREFRLSLSSDTVAENQGAGVRLTIKRTGNTEKSLTAQLSVDKAGVVEVPSSVIIPAGNKSTIVTVKPIDNSIVDGKREVRITCSANKYESGEIVLSVTDDEMPSVRIELNGDRLREGGEVIVGRVIRDLVTDEPLTVYLSGVSTSRCSYPSYVVIPAGEESVSFEISVIDNDTAEALANMTLRAAAAGYIGDTKNFEVEDDDIPGVRLDIYPERISEGAGVKAAYATLTRVDEDKLAKAITVRLSADKANQLILPDQITIPAYTMSVRFSIGVVDNALDDGDRLVEVTGAVVIESCGCDSQPSSGDNIISQVSVVDDDGPTLILKSSPTTLREGVEEAGWLTVSHNSSTFEDVTVMLSFDVENEIELPEEVVIPAGQQSAIVPIKTLDDGIQDGGKLVSIYADDKAGVFASGSTWLQVSDQNLPDICLEQLSVSPNPIIGGTSCQVTFSIANNGVASYEGMIPYRAYWVSKSSAQPVQNATNKTGHVDGGLEIDESREISFAMSAPAMPGNYCLVISVDPDRSIPDLDELNNEGKSEEVSVMPSFITSVAVDRHVYQVGDLIAISGHAVNADGVTPASSQNVEVYIITEGVRRSFDTKTDADGSFSISFEPQSGEMGHYVVGACYPGQNASGSQAEFDILGFWRSPNSYVVSDLVVGDRKEHRITVRNKSSVPLTGITAAVIGLSEGFEVSVSDIDDIAAYSMSELLIAVDAIGATEGSEYKYFSVRLESAEGAAIEIPMAAYVSPAHARLIATPQNLKTTITVGKESYLTYTITNEGAGDSGRVRIALPNVSWLRVVGRNEIDNLKSGETAKILIEATPPNVLLLNKVYSGTIGIGCDNGQTFSLGLSLIPVSDETGSLKVDVVDTLTLTTQGAPHLKGATVSVTNPTTGEVVARGETDDDGVFLATNIPTGAYDVSVVADNHTSKHMEMIVSPGDTSGNTIYLDYNGVSYSWKVTRTEIEDQYAIDLVMDYETNVPVPAMKVTAPEEIPALREGESFVCGVEIENCGLIALQDIRLSLGGSIGEYTYEQISPDITLLPAKSSQTIYVKFTNPARSRLRLAAEFGSRSARDDIEQAQYAPCTTFFQAWARAGCGEKGVDLLMKSKHIRMVGHMCDLLLFTEMQMLNALGGLGGMSGAAPSMSASGGSGGEPLGSLVEPPVSEEKMDCACLIKVIDMALKVPLDKIRGDDIWDFVEESMKYKNFKDFAKDYLNGVITDALNPYKAFINHIKKSISDIKAKIRGKECELTELYEIIKDALELSDACTKVVGLDKINKAIAKLREEIAALENIAALLESLLNQPLINGRMKMAVNQDALSDLAEDIDDETAKKFIIACYNLDELLSGLGYRGVADIERFFEDTKQELRAIREGSDVLAVCSTVSFQLSQTVAMTREAFNGSLTLKNSDFSGQLTEVKLVPIVTDGDGNNRTELFGITDRDHSGFSGSTFLGGDLELDGGATGTANILFVPTVQAALEEPTLYYFGGILSYYDSVLGETVTHKLIPVPMVVNPCPQLTLDYFVQRDVYGDDPFTVDVVEPSVPAELAVLIRNNGKGEAKNTVIKSIQPQALENDKGLAIDFALKDYSLDATALNGSTAHLGLSDVNLGTIAANDCAVAQWWLTSSIEGHFSGVSATVTHLNSWGNPDTSLISDVRVHKLVRSIAADDDVLPDFLTTTDAFGNPEEIYTSQGDILSIRNDAKCTVEGSLGGEMVNLKVSASVTGSGWQCLTCTIDGLSDYVVESVARGDGEQLSIRNAWITDRVFRSGTNPLYRDDLHIIDCIEQVEPANYVVRLVRKPSEFPEVSYFEEASGGVENSVRDCVTVVFTSPIDPSTFNWMDISLIAQGEWVSSTLQNGVISGLQSLVVTPVDDSNTKFVISGLSSWCSLYGRYELTVQCAGIQDANGTFGRNGKSFSWIFSDADPSKPYISRSQGLDGECFYISFPELVNRDEISFESLVVKRDGADVQLPTSAVVKMVSDREIAVLGLDSAFAEDGEYQLSYGESSSASWQVRTQPPAPATDLYITPDEGESASDGITCATRLTIHGTLAPDTPIVAIYYVLPDGDPVQISDFNRIGQAVDATLELNGGGNVTFIIRSSDQYGNESEALMSVFVDTIPLSAKLQAIGEEGASIEEAILSFDDDVFDVDVVKDDFELTRDGLSVSLADVQLVKVDDRTFVLKGLGTICCQDGAYRLCYNSTSVRKLSSGLKAMACDPVAWACIQQDDTPPQIVEVLFDGEVPVTAYADHEMFSQISVRFTEAVNIPALIESGLIGSALRIELLNKDNDVTGSVTADDVTWNEQSFTAMLTIDKDRVPCGRARFVIDTSLVADLSGNKLALSDGFDVISGYKTYTPSLFMRGAAYAYACPTLTDWNSDGLLDLIVGEETPEMKGKVRIYRNRGTKDNPIYDDYTYLKIGDDDVEFEAQGCVGMQVSFGGVRNASMILAASNGEIYGWRHRARNQITKEPYPMELLFDHTTDARFAALIRAQAFCYDIDGDGSDEIIVSGQNSPMFWIKRLGIGDETHVECTPLMDQHGEYLRFPEGQSHTTAILLDVNGDKIPDLVTGDTTGNVWVYLGAENGRFASLPTRIYENTETSNTRSRLAVGDIDGDGVEDILVGRKDGSILKLKGEAMLTPAVSFKRVELKSVEQALGEDLYWVDGAEGWICQQSGESAQAFVSHESDGEATLLTARFVGKGVVTFTWSVSDANGNSSFRCVGGDSSLEKFGTFASVTQSIVVSTNGNHQFVWTFSGKGKAVISDVSFVPTSPETQVTQTSAVPIKFADIRRFANAIWKEKDGDYEATVTSIAANGKTVEENCIAGIDSSDPDAAFKAAIEVVNGVPKVSPEPDLGDQRVYTFWGCESLESGEWKVITTEDIPLWRFFKVSVEMK